MRKAGIRRRDVHGQILGQPFDGRPRGGAAQTDEHADHGKIHPPIGHWIRADLNDADDRPERDDEPRPACE